MIQLAMMKYFISPASLLACALILSGNSSLAAGLSGAIFTTNSNGTVVNGNQYDSPCSVYLDGGPGIHAPVTAAGLPDGDYYFQVTDPSGKTLLSTDPVSNRSFHVSGGVIVAYTGTGGPAHITGPDQSDPAGSGAITIRLANLSCPADFAVSPNNGGAYKVWVTPVASYISGASCANGCFFGFVPSASKTDNFKVNAATATFCLTIQKLFLQSGGALTVQANWEFDVMDSLAVTNKYFTDTTGQVLVCDLQPGSYTVDESMNSGTTFTVVGLIVNNVLQPAGSTGPSYTFSWAVGQPAPVITFENQTGTVITLQ